MTKEKKQALTQELINRLSDDGYCFDQEHSAEIARLKAEIEDYRLKAEAVKGEIVKAVEAATAPLNQKIKEQGDKIYDLEEELKKIKDESETWREMWEASEKKLTTAPSEIERAFYKSGRCFNLLHAAFDKFQKGGSPI